MAILVLWAFLLGCTPLKNTDIWWHLRTGRWILENGWVPQVDLYTFTDWDKPWTDLHWGFQLLATALYWLGGVDALVLAKATCLAATVAVGWLASGRDLPASAKALCWLLPTICLSGRAVVRPEMLSLIFLGVWLWIVTRMETRPRLIWILPLLQIVWVNCHALFVLGLVVGAAYVADRAAREFFGGRWGLPEAGESPAPVVVFRAGVVVLLASLVNPYFEEGALFPLVLFRKFTIDQQFYSSIGEFTQPIDFVRRAGLFASLYLVAELTLWLLTAASFVWLGLSRRISLMRLLLFASFSYLAWEASRNTAIFALISGVVLCANCGETLRLRAERAAKTRRPSERLRKRSNFQPASWDGATRGRQAFAITVAVFYAGLITAVITGHWARWNSEGKRFALGEAKNWYIHDAARFAGQPGFPTRAFVANSGQAAVYIFHNAPEHRVFIDGRLEVISKQTFALFADIRRMMSAGNQRWQSILADEKGALPAVVLDARFSRPEIQGMLNTPNWRLVFADRTAAVFLDAEKVKELGLSQADHRILIRPPSD